MKPLQIALKDVRVWTRDIAALGVLLAMPIVLIFILGAALGGAGQESKIKVALVNLDRGVTRPAAGQPDWSSVGTTVRYGEELVDAFKESKRLNGVFDVVYANAAEEKLQWRVAKGELVAVAVIPEDFSELVASAKPARITVYTDPGSGLSAGIFESVVRSFAGHYSAASVAVQTVLKEAEAIHPEWFWPRGMESVEPARLQQAAITEIEGSPAVVVKDVEADVDNQLNALSYYAVSMTAMFLMFGAMFGAFSTIKERREQTLSRLLSTPTSGMAITAGKMLGVFALGMAQFTVLYLATRFGFRVDWGRDVLAIYLVAAAEMLAVTGLAVLIASLARTERGAGGLGPLVIQIQALLGGAFFAITILPAWLQPVRYVSIVGWALEGWQTVQLKGGGAADVMAPVAALVGFAAVFFLLGSMLTGVRR